MVANVIAGLEVTSEGPPPARTVLKFPRVACSFNCSRTAWAAVVATNASLPNVVPLTLQVCRRATEMAPIRKRTMATMISMRVKPLLADLQNIIRPPTDDYPSGRLYSHGPCVGSTLRHRSLKNINRIGGGDAQGV